MDVSFWERSSTEGIRRPRFRRFETVSTVLESERTDIVCLATCPDSAHQATMTQWLIANPRGSTWHRWDPHIHAPGTLSNDQFNQDWDAYLTRIETAQPVVRALGVTDYFCIQTYREVRRRKRDQRRLPNVELLFPNVELRLDIKTEKQKPINLHLLFSPDDPDHETEIERILGKLTFSGPDTEYRCSIEDLIRLGKAAEPNQTDFQGALRVGANQFKTTLKDVRNLFKTEKWMRDNCLVAVASKSGDGTSGLQGDDSYAMTRRDIESFADIIFAGNPKQRAFWLGETAGADRECIERTYRGLKPCLHGSDAHRNDTVAVPDLKRFCWVKGDVTFETLRQAVIEPADRVWLGEQPPRLGSSTEAIAKLDVSGTEWFRPSSLQINSGLVAVIGARGSGKTALADIIATGAAATPGGTDVASFLTRAAGHLNAAAVQLAWADGSTSSRRELEPSPFADDEWPQALYLSQHFVDRLCSATGLATELRREIERVIFESVEPTERYETNSFEELAEFHLTPILERRGELRGLLRAAGDAVAVEEERKEQLPAKLRELDVLRKQLEADRKALNELLPKNKVAHVAHLTLLESCCTTATSRVERLRRQRKTIHDLAAETKHIEESSEPARHTEMKRRFASAGLHENSWLAFLMQFRGDVSSVVAQALEQVENWINHATNGPPDWQIPPGQQPTAEWPLNSLLILRDEARKAVGIDVERHGKYEERQKLLAQRELKGRRLETEVKDAEGAEQRRKEHVELRRTYYRMITETIVEEEEVLRALYAPIRNRVENGAGALGRLAFSVRRRVDLDAWCAAGEDLIDLRSGTRFRGRGSLKKEAERYLLTAWKSGDAKTIASAMDDFRSAVASDLIAAMPAGAAANRRAWLRQLADWLYDTSHIAVHYGIEYDGVSIEHLSPGTRGIVLLLLYLAIDQSDTRPLIIDQPEENLDPNSVYAELVPHFREARKRRQVIVVTHNANLVVNTDADQLIVAKSVRVPGQVLPDISYQSGGLENKKVRAAVCDILEGGERAFLEREKRYRLKWGESLALEPFEQTETADATIP